MSTATWARLSTSAGLLVLALAGNAHGADKPAPKPNVVLILADDLGFADLGCYGSEIATPNVDRLAAGGLRFTQFYNAGRCCPTRAALLTGLYPHEAGVGHMLGAWHAPSYTAGIGENTATIAELLRPAGYRTYHVGKWHVGGVNAKADQRNHPMNRGFDRAYGTAGGGNYFRPAPLYLDRDAVEPGDNFYVTDAFSDHAVAFLEEHGQQHAGQPFFLHLCYTAPHFPLQAKRDDIAKYRGRYRDGWDRLRERRFARQKDLGIMPRDARLAPRDPVATAWADVPESERDEWDQRMAVYAAMIDCMDQGVGQVLSAVDRLGVRDNTLVLFLSDNGASAEALDSWPNPSRGHKPGAVVGTADSHRCLEVGWADAANTPYREHKMWIHQGGIASPLVVCWPAGIKARGDLSRAVGHVIDLMPTMLELAGAAYPASLDGRQLLPLSGRSLAPALRGEKLGARTLAWEHEGNRGIRVGDWKLVASFRGDWELYDLAGDPTETSNLAAREANRARELAAQWQAWADRVGVVPWEDLPGGNYKPTPGYRKKSEPVE
ncbi:MAG: arylsulfatase [Planctomycetia bacterium]|nr:arylsulfatase [Planctomycetia bacterium]